MGNGMVGMAIVIVLLLGAAAFIPGIITQVNNAGNVTPGTEMGNQTNSTNTIVSMLLTGNNALIIVLGAGFIIAAFAFALGGRRW